MDMVFLFFGLLALSKLVHGQDQSGVHLPLLFSIFQTNIVLIYFMGIDS